MEVSFEKVLRKLIRNPGAMVGLFVLILMILVAIFAPNVATHDPNTVDVLDKLTRPSAEHYFGTDTLGRDLFSRIVHGARISLAVGLIAVTIGLAGGGLLGTLAGYYPRLDSIIMRLMDVQMAFPDILLAIAIIAALGPDLVNAIIAIGIQGIPVFARITRARVLSVREELYIEAARAVGAGNSRILARHVLPNILATLLVYCTLRLGTTILAAAILSFLGLGAQPPTPEWGAIVSDARHVLDLAPHAAFFPIGAIFLTVLSLNLLGDGLRDALDPRL
jgi:peptide/nickel transport system permease protein